MTPQDYARLRDAFLALRELPPEEQRAAAERQFPDDEPLRHELCALIRTIETDTNPLGSPALAGAVRERLVDEIEANVAEDDLRGVTIDDRYAVRRRLGRGAHSTVYLAMDNVEQREIALKLLDLGFGAASARERFGREARILAALDHVGISRLFDEGEARVDGCARSYLAMEYVEGCDIVEYARQRRLGPRQRLDLLAYICRAVHHAHERGVVHRDLKPSNILVNPGGQPKVLDFGVARLLEAELDDDPVRARTEEGALIGTVAYMSPEQAAGNAHAADERSDLYSLGVIGYQLLAHRLPYDLAGRDVQEQLQIIQQREPASLGAIDPRLAGSIESIIHKAIAKRAADRYDSVWTFASDIRAHLRGGEVEAAALVQVNQFDHKKSRGKRKPTLRSGLIIVASLIIAAGGVWFGWMQSKRATEEADAARTHADEAITQSQSESRKSISETRAMMRMLLQTADDLAAQGEHRKALDLYLQLHETHQRVVGDSDPDSLISLLQRIAEMHAALEDYAKASEAMSQAIELAGERFGADDWRVQDMLLRDSEYAERAEQ